jgi:type IV secretion system protein TrbL
MQFNTLTLTLQNFITVLSGAYGRIQDSATALLGLLVGIEVVLLGLWTALGGGDNVVGIFKRILHIGAWVWIVQSYPTLCKDLVGSLVKAGLLAGGGSGDVSLLMDPSRLAGYGLDATAPLTQKLADLGMTDISDLIVFGFGYLAILACFLIMAINVFLAVLEYYVFAALAGIFLPFGLLAPTKFLAEKAIGAVVSASVKLMVLGLVTAIIDPVLSSSARRSTKSAALSCSRSKRPPAASWRSRRPRSESGHDPTHREGRLEPPERTGHDRVNRAIRSRSPATAT